MPNLFQNYSELIPHGQKQVRQDVLKCLEVGIIASDPGHGTRRLVRFWLEEEYPAIRKEAEKEKAQIYVRSQN